MKLPWFFIGGGSGSLYDFVFVRYRNSSSPAGMHTGGGLLRHSGSSASSGPGSITAPERMCAPIADAFSITQTRRSGFSCFSRIANASPEGPAPTVTTSYSMNSRSLIVAAPARSGCGILRVKPPARPATDAKTRPARRHPRDRPRLRPGGRARGAVRRTARGNPVGNPRRADLRARDPLAAVVVLDRRPGRELRLLGRALRAEALDTAPHRAAGRRRRGVRRALQQRAREPLSRRARRYGLPRRRRARARRRARHRVAEPRRDPALR